MDYTSSTGYFIIDNKNSNSKNLHNEETWTPSVVHKALVHIPITNVISRSKPSYYSETIRISVLTASKTDKNSFRRKGSLSTESCKKTLTVSLRKCVLFCVRQGGV